MKIIKLEKFKELSPEEKFQEINKLREEYTCRQIAREWGKSDHFVYAITKHMAAQSKHTQLKAEYKKMILADEVYRLIRQDMDVIINRIIDAVVNRV